MIGWALRQCMLLAGIALMGFLLVDRLPAYLASHPVRPAVMEAKGTDQRAAPRTDALVFPADAAGHVVVDAEIDGAPVRLLLDTGASLLTLSEKDARAAGISISGLSFDRRVTTANGIAKMAPVTLRQIQIGQLSIRDVPGAVLSNLNVSLLGMSLLQRLPNYRIGSGRLTIRW